ncbi:MAG: PAS domain S-box protein [Anaerolineae bacterium]|nr:PAS domain S-box protein [Anaerolineae bacterium]
MNVDQRDLKIREIRHLVASFTDIGSEGNGGVDDDLDCIVKGIKELTAAKQREAPTFDEVPFGMAYTALDGRLLRVNRKLCEITGYSADELLGMNFQTITHPDDLTTNLHKHKQALAGLIKAYRLDKRYIRKDGTPVWVNVTGSVAKDEQGKPSHLVAVVEDGLDRDRIDAQRHAITIGLRKVLAATNRLMACPNIDTMLLQAIEVARDTLGLERCGIFFEQDDYLYGTYGTDGAGNTTDEHNIRITLQDDWLSHIKQLRADEAQWLMVDNRGRTEWDGKEIKVVGNGWIVATLIPLADGRKGYLFNDTHITNTPIDETQQEIVAVFCSLLGKMIQRREVEAALQESETRLQQAVRAASIGIFDHDHLKDTIHWSVVQRNISGWENNEPTKLEDSWHQIHEDDRERVKAAVRRAHDPKGDGVYSIEYRVIATDGSIRWLSVHSLTAFEGEGDQRHPVRTLGASVDITDQRRTQEALRNSEQMLRNILDSIPARVFWKDENLRFLGCNQRFADDMGVATPDDLIGKTTQDLIKEHDVPWLDQAVRYEADDDYVIETGGSILNHEEPQIRGDKRLYWVRANKLPLRNADGKITGLLCTYEDITERRQTELALQKKREEEQELLTYLKLLHEISLELTIVDSLDDFYRRTVELGLERLGFDRMSLWLYDAQQNTAIGTYGTDLNGRRQSEAHMHFVVEPKGGFWESLHKPDRFVYEEKAPLHHNFEVAGTGWIVTIALRLDNRLLGWLSVDNLFRHQPISQPQLEILAQYGMHIGTMLARKQVKQALQESQIFLQKSQTVGRIGSYYFDVRSGVWQTSQMLDELFGIDGDYPKNLDGWLALVHPSHREELRQDLRPETLVVRRRFDKEFRIFRHNDGRECWMHGMGEIEVDDDDHIVRIIGTIQDISARKRTENALRESEQMLQNVLNTIPVRVFWRDINLILMGCNQAFANDASVSSPEELIGKTEEEILPDPSMTAQSTQYLRQNQYVLETGQSLLGIEETQQRADGKLYWLRTSKIPLRDAEGHIIGILGMYEDITDHKHAEERLRESEDLLQKSQMVGRIGSYFFNVNEGTWISSPILDELFGINEDYPKTTEGWLALVQESQREEMRKALSQDVLTKQRRFDKEFRITRHKDGQECWMHGIGELDFDSRGRVIKMVGTIQDITARKRTENALRESEQMLQNVLNTIPVRVFWKDTQLRLIGCNQAFVRDANVNLPDDLIGRTDENLLPNPAWNEQAQRYRTDDQYVLNSGLPLLNYEETQMRADGILHWLQTSKVPLRDAEGNIIGVLGTYEDVTERKRNEEQLRESERRLLEAQQLAHVGHWDVTNGTLTWSDETYRIWGLKRQLEPVAFDKLLELVHPEDRAGFQQTLAVSRQTKSSFENEFRIIRSDGSMRYIHGTGHLSLDEHGEISRLFGTMMDITERRQSQEALQRFNQRLSILREIDHRILVAHSPVDLAATVLDQLMQLIPCDWSGIVLYDKALTEEHVYALQFSSGINIESQKKLPIIRQDVIERLKLGQSLIAADIATTDKPPSYLAESLIHQGVHAAMSNPLLIQGELIGVLVLASKQIGFFTGEHQQIAEDIAAQIAIALRQADLNDQIARQNAQLEERVRERTAELQQANDEVKNFAYIVSHDLRAPLVNLKGFAAELRISLNDVESVCAEVKPMLDAEKVQRLTNAIEIDIPESLRFINSSVTQMDGFTKAILKLSRLGRSSLELVEVDVSSVVDKILASLGYQINQGKIKVHIGTLPAIVMDYLSLEQIFGNILTNAVTYLDPGRPGEIFIDGHVTEKETIFRIRDNGRGIAKEDMDKVFAPFRRAGTQNAPGEGMGMAYVQALVRRHGGQIWCESELGLGTTFTFTISRHLIKDIRPSLQIT